MMMPKKSLRPTRGGALPSSLATPRQAVYREAAGRFVLQSRAWLGSCR